MKVEERLLKYIAIKTPCDENSDTVPTSQCQFDLARILADELKELGLNYVPGQAVDADVKVAISNSFGFGGHNATLLFKKYAE